MAGKTTRQPIDTRQYRTSFRLIFRFDGTRIELREAVRLQKVAMGTSLEPPKPGANSGSWLALVDGRDRVLFHRHLYDPLQMRAELHSPDGKIELHLRDPEPCEFWAIVPDIPGGSEVVLYSSPFKRETMTEAAGEIARFKLPGEERHGDER